MERLKVILTMTIFIGIVFSGICLIVTRAQKKKAQRIAYVNKNYSYVKGRILELHAYKSHSIVVRYRIKDKSYKYSGGWDYNPLSLNEGDSIRLRYAVDDPEQVITELEKAY
ncbi:hypothetical protein F0L74_20895 [Chitinophaga agrisoli]|uniref:DUF3592 domain-containing protein n=1 Tax=Chitinophaga agrisoli TaxID=2607653 RepID=A0A5B2VKA4_9BACT|nr:DUF3592 domain-containing protein [Chitinophaga agrisoli]KAA2238679.1 hypothetical protein F0L74_20895 [Chitinophaga agrisoli]